MTMSRIVTDASQQSVGEALEVTVKDVERLKKLLQIFGDPRVRVEVSHGDAQKKSTLDMPASSRFQFTTY